MKLLHHLARQKYIIGFFLAWVARVALSLGALALCLLSPPLVNFRPDPSPALALSIAGALALLLPPAIRVHWRFRLHLKAAQASAAAACTASLRAGESVGNLDGSPSGCKGAPTHRFAAKDGGGTRSTHPSPPQARPSAASVLPIAIQIVGFFLLCAAICWAVLAQPIALNMPVALVESLRALPVVAVAGLAGLLLVRLAWQRRAVAALLLPTLLALSFIAIHTPPFVLDFRPYWLAVDGHGALYVSDVESPVIRVFGPDGSLQAKLRPRIAARVGPPGTGFSPPGPWNDPDQLGVPSLTGQPSSAGWLRPWPPNTDEFLFCGLATDTQNRLYVLDWLGNQMLRFTPDGRLDAMWPLPKDYQPSTGCLALHGDRLYVGDQRGSVLIYDLSGHLLATQTLPGQLSGLSIDPSGRSLYALIANQVWRETLATHQTMLWNLPPPRGSLGFPYETLLALPNDQVLVSNLNSNQLLRYTGEGRLLGTLGGFGNQPGQFASVGALALGNDGSLYVTDSDHRVVQRFAPDGTVDGFYRGPDDDEND